MLNNDQVNYLNSPINPKETEAIIKILPIKNSPGTDSFSAEFWKRCREELILILLKLFHKIETEGTLLNSFYEDTVTLLYKQYKDPTKKENLKPISTLGDEHQYQPARTLELIGTRPPTKEYTCRDL